MSNTSPSIFSRLFDRISIQDRINFARHLSLVVKAGLPVFEGLKIIQEQTESPVLKRVIEGLMEDVNSGKFLADGLQKYEYIFGSFFINIVRVGESAERYQKTCFISPMNCGGKNCCRAKCVPQWSTRS